MSCCRDPENPWTGWRRRKEQKLNLWQQTDYINSKNINFQKKKSSE